MYGTAQDPLGTLGDRLEAAAGTAIANGSGRPARRRWVVVPMGALAVLVVVVGLLVLPTKDGGGSAEAAVLSAADRTTGAETGRFQLTAEVSGLPGLGPDGIALTVDGAFDLPADRYSASVDLADLASGLPTEALDGAAPGGVGRVEAVVDGDDVYVHLGSILSLFGSDAEWVHATAPELTQGSADSPLPPLQDPAALLDALQGAGADMVEVGRDPVQGVDATHYQGTLSTAEALDSLDSADRADLEAALGGVLDQVALPDLPVDVWIDDDGFVRRISIALDGSSLGVPDVAGTAFGITIEFSDLGQSVDIPVPAADEVLDADQLLQDLSSTFDGFELPSVGDLEELFGGLDLPDELTDELGDLDLGQLEDELADLFGGSDGGSDDGGSPASPSPSTPAPGPTAGSGQGTGDA